MNRNGQEMVITCFSLMNFPYEPDRLSMAVNDEPPKSSTKNGYLVAAIIFGMKQTQRSLEETIAGISMSPFNDESVEEIWEIWNELLPVSPIWAAFAFMQTNHADNEFCLKTDESVMIFVEQISQFAQVAKQDKTFNDSLNKVPGFNLRDFYQALSKTDEAHVIH